MLWYLSQILGKIGKTPIFLKIWSPSKDSQTEAQTIFHEILK